MTQLIHDSENNVLHIMKKPQEKQKWKDLSFHVI